MSDINIPILGGKAHLSAMVHSNAEQITIDGDEYVLKLFVSLGNRPFYVLKSIDWNPHLAVQSYLEAIGYGPRELCTKHATWFKKISSHRLRRDSYVHLNARNFFVGIPADIEFGAFKERLHKYMFVTRLPILHQIILSLKAAFPHAFFAPFNFPVGKERREEALKSVPLMKNISTEIHRLLNPKTVDEAELLVLTMAYYCSSTAYLSALVKGRQRVDLRGARKEQVSRAERRYAARLLLNRRFTIQDHLLRELNLVDVNK